MSTKKAEHIPEPWAGIVFPHEGFTHVVTEGPDQVATVNAPGYAGMTEEEQRKGLEQRMNLILAAPELLAALEMVAAEVEEGYLSEKQEKQIDAAIAKARGAA